jgi:ribosome-associated toxin RatA of RatAB toxin-antitoxin module
MIELGDLPNSNSTDDALCEAVQLTVTKLEGRQRRVEATINLPYPAAQVWQVLTDYEALAEFIPNLSKSCRLPHPTGGIRIEQIGVQNLRVVTFSARVVLDMTEEFPSALRFAMVEGDFKQFSGAWLLEPMADNEAGTNLTYVLDVWPKATIPVIAIEQRLKKDLPRNLCAIRDRLAAQTVGLLQS